jgi:hypothetical protein
MKHSKQTILNPLVQLLAAGAVFVWLAASGFCAFDTLIGHAEANAGHIVEKAASTHHDSAPTQDSDRHDGHGRSCCSSLQAAESALQSVVFEKPDFGRINILLSGWSTLLFTLSERQETFSSKTPERKWVFTPEVCLGPAFRSLAPPLAV